MMRLVITKNAGAPLDFGICLQSEASVLLAFFLCFSNRAFYLRTSLSLITETMPSSKPMAFLLSSTARITSSVIRSP